MANIVYKENCPPLGSCPNKSHPLATAWMQKPQGGGKCLVQIYRCAWGGGVMDGIDTCIIKMWNNIKKNWLYEDYLHWLNILFGIGNCVSMQRAGFA